MNRIQTVISSALIAAVMAVAPLAASADTLRANASNGVVISASGIVNVIGADVTAVGNGFINAASTLGATVINWIVNISAATKIDANGSANASTTGNISVGDKVNFKGSLSNLGSAITVSASKVRDVTDFQKVGGVTGKVTGVNSANGSFTLKTGNHTVTVQTTASTTVLIDGASSNVASLQNGDKAKVAGTLNASSTVITASKISAKSEHENNDSDDGDKDKKEHDNDNRGNRGDDGRSSSNKGAHNLTSIFARFHIFGKDD